MHNLIEKRKDIETFLVVTGDADFSEMVMELLERQKQVILVASENSQSKYYECHIQGGKRFTIEKLEDFVLAE